MLKEDSTLIGNGSTMRARVHILFGLLAALWLVMQVAVPAFHTHGRGERHASCQTLQWQNGDAHEHECHVCHLNYHPSAPALPALTVALPEETLPSLAPTEQAHSADPHSTPPVRAPPAA